MEGRLENATPLLVGRLIPREDAVAYEFPKQGGADVTHEEVLAMDEDVLNPFRFVDEVEALIQDAEMGNRAELPGRFHEKWKRLPDKAEDG